MVALKIKKGLDIPLKGAPDGEIKPLEVGGRPVKPQTFALDLSPFEGRRFRLLVKPGDKVKIGEPLVADKSFPNRLFVSPAAGTVQEIERGAKRRLLSIPIAVDEVEEKISFPPLNPLLTSREGLLARIAEGGLLPFIRQRPFDLIADPRKIPRDIFVQGANSAPFAPPAELQADRHKEDLIVGLEALKRLTSGKVHLVLKEDSPLLNLRGVELHTVSGPHPSGLASTHIHFIAPITKVDDIVWTLGIPEVIAIGHLLRKGVYLTDRILAIGGEGAVDGRTGFFLGRLGFPIATLIEGRLPRGDVRLISGDPLTGQKVESRGHLGFYHHTLSLIPERKGRELFHFLRLGLDKFSASGTYLSSFLKKRLFSFDTNLHGEKRFFITGSPYEKVVPLNLNPMLLVKSILGENYEEAEKLGLLEVAPEDFALSSFVCPCKIEMIEIVKKGLNRYSAEVTDHL